MNENTDDFPLSERFSRALARAHHLHSGQVRKGRGTPYVGHLLAVAAHVLEAGGDEDEAIAALLHDAAEDQGGAGTLADIRSEFGDRVADIVDSCSDTLETPKPPWRRRKETYIAHLDNASQSVLLVVAADKVHNCADTLRDFLVEGDAVWDRFKAGREQTLWFYHSVLEVLEARGDDRVKPLAAQLRTLLANW